MKTFFKSYRVAIMAATLAVILVVSGFVTAKSEPLTETISVKTKTLMSNEKNIQPVGNTGILNAEDSDSAEAGYVPPKYVVPCSETDYQNLLRIVEAEATGSDLNARMAVANVILNRVKAPGRWSNNITEVIFWGNGKQFSPIKDGRFYTVSIKPITVEAVNRALAGEDNSMGATFFCSAYSAAKGNWHTRALKRLFQAGGNVFFKE